MNETTVTRRPSPAPRVRASLPLRRHLSLLAVLTSTPAPSPTGVQTPFPLLSSALWAANRHLATCLPTALHSVKKCYLPVLPHPQLKVSKTEPLALPASRPPWPRRTLLVRLLSPRLQSPPRDPPLARECPDAPRCGLSHRNCCPQLLSHSRTLSLAARMCSEQPQWSPVTDAVT